MDVDVDVDEPIISWLCSSDIVHSQVYFQIVSSIMASGGHK